MISSGNPHQLTLTEPITDESQSISVLCVDLDGTLARTDLLWECLLSLLKTRPLILLMVPWWLLRGKAYLKSQLARRANIDLTVQPYRREILDLISSRRAAGSSIVLVSACAQELAIKVAEHLKCFDSVFASEPGRNLKGQSKARFLQAKFGDRGFDYVGDSRADLKVWKFARYGYVVGSSRLSERAARVTQVRGIVPVKPIGLRTWFSALRGHHWFKNTLLFLPLALAHKVAFYPLLKTAAGFVLFGMCASGLYVLNDLLDLHSDREHPWKRKRPFAAGDVSIASGLLIAFALLGTALPGAFLLNIKFGTVLLLYAVMTMWYSLHLKTIVVLDVFVLSGFYTIRIWAGALITSIVLSQWFLSFSLFFFLSLAMAKRYSELVHASELVRRGNSGRGYKPQDAEVVMNVGIASSFSAVVIFSLYVNSREVAMLYQNPEALLLLAPVLAYWLSRLWIRAHRGELDDDPMTLALSDRGSYAVAMLAALILGISMIRITGS